MEQSSVIIMGFAFFSMKDIRNKNMHISKISLKLKFQEKLNSYLLVEEEVAAFVRLFEKLSPD